MDIINYILAALTIAAALGTVAGVFYGQRQKVIIQTLTESNNAYKERNTQLESEATRKDAEYVAKIAELEGRISTLEKIKTPPLEPLYLMIDKNHKQVMKAITGKAVQ